MKEKTKAILSSWQVGSSNKEDNSGGFVPGTGNRDTVPAMLTPGEFVVKREAVQKYGVDTLSSMNSMTKSLPSYEGGGTVDERKFDKKRYYKYISDKGYYL